MFPRICLLLKQKKKKTSVISVIMKWGHTVKQSKFNFYDGKDIDPHMWTQAAKRLKEL